MIKPTFLEKISASKWTFAGLFITIFFLTHLRQNSHTNYDCEICSDKAGYYMYLPALSHYGFQASAYPAGFDQAHGGGFWFDTTHDRVVTKFTCGVALMQAPFYFGGALISSLFGLEEEPYSRYYLLFINIGLAFYCAVGLYCLKRWLEYYTSQRNALAITLVALFGTNLLYYVTDESLMSHAYSFSLLSMALYSSRRWGITMRWSHFVVMCTALALSILIRPTNVLFVLIILFIDVRSTTELKSRFLQYFTLKNSVVAAGILFIVFVPQMCYWKFAYGHYFVWSYTGEGFTNWSNPWLLTVWFSPQSGLFPYCPILIGTIALLISGLFKRRTNSGLILVVFLMVSYLCASWSNPFFGDCNFGKRPMVEFLPVLLFPLAGLLNSLSSKPQLIKWLVRGSLILFVAYNLWLIGGFDTCFGGQTWDWNQYAELLKKGTFLP